MTMKNLPFAAIFFLLFLFSQVACISRVLEVRTDPPGALVYLDGEEIGRTPLQRPFSDYGYHQILVAKENYQSLNRLENLKPPWWCCFPFDLFAELYPGTLEDRRLLTYNLSPSPKAQTTLSELLRNLDNLRGKLIKASKKERRPEK